MIVLVPCLVMLWLVIGWFVQGGRPVDDRRRFRVAVDAAAPADRALPRRRRRRTARRLNQKFQRGQTVRVTEFLSLYRVFLLLPSFFPIFFFYRIVFYRVFFSPISFR